MGLVLILSNVQQKGAVILQGWQQVVKLGIPHLPVMGHFSASLLCIPNTLAGLELPVFFLSVIAI
jgi:hypothetical protein